MTKPEVSVGHVVRWGEGKQLGIVKKIRVIKSGQFVETFSGDLEEAVLTLWDGEGTYTVWAGRAGIEKAMDTESKDFKSRLNKKSPRPQETASQ